MERHIYNDLKENEVFEIIKNEMDLKIELNAVVAL